MAGAIIGGAIGGLGSFASGKAQADAMTHAADLQSASNQKALDFAKQRYGQLQQNEAPYQRAGASAAGGIGDLLNRAAVAKGYGAPMAPQQVLLQAPDGSTRSFPQDQAQHYISLGAKPVQQT
jgi:hypothetical protein